MVLFLSFMCLLNIASLLGDGIAKLVYKADYIYSPVFIYYMSPVFKILIPLRDLLIALSFTYLYYY